MRANSSPKADVTGYLADPVKGVSTAFAFLFTVSCLLNIWQCRYAKILSYSDFPSL